MFEHLLVTPLGHQILCPLCLRFAVAKDHQLCIGKSNKRHLGSIKLTKKEYQLGSHNATMNTAA